MQHDQILFKKKVYLNGNKNNSYKILLNILVIHKFLFANKSMILLNLSFIIYNIQYMYIVCVLLLHLIHINK